MYTDKIIAINSLTTMRANIRESNSYIKSLALETDINIMNEYKDKIQAATEEVHKLFNAYKQTITTSANKQITAQLDSSLTTYRNIREKMLSIDFTSPQSGKQINDMQKDSQDIYNKLLDDLQKVQDFNTDAAKTSWKETTVLFHQSTKITIIIIIVAVLIATMIGTFIVRSITLQIELLSKLLSNIVNLDLSTYAQTEYGAEFRQMFKAFNNMSENLRGIIRNVVVSSNTVKDATENVVDKNEQTQTAMGDIITMVSDLSNEMTQQSLNLQESSKAMNEMAMGVQNIVESSTSVTQMSMETS